MLPVVDPFTRAILCWCGLLHTSELHAACCRHRPPVPYVPGLPESESALRRPAFVPTTRPRLGFSYGRSAGRRRYRALRLLLAALVIVAFWSCAIGGGIWWASAHPGGGPAPGSYPTTYGPPGPRGGVR
jgi:hypothetical protein